MSPRNKGRKKSTANKDTSRDLSRPTQFRRVGASIGHKSSPTLHSLLKDHVPGVLIDEEDGLVAMFQEIHRSMPDTGMDAAMQRALQQLWRAWLSVHAVGQDTSRALTDPDIGMTAMFREFVTEPAAPAVLSATAFLDALLAHLLHSFYTVQHTAAAAAADTAELVIPTPTAPIDDDISMAGMLREVSQQFPRMRTDDMERHLLGRLQQISQESKLEPVVEDIKL